MSSESANKDELPTLTKDQAKHAANEAEQRAENEDIEQSLKDRIQRKANELKDASEKVTPVHGKRVIRGYEAVELTALHLYKQLINLLNEAGLNISNTEHKNNRTHDAQF